MKSQYQNRKAEIVKDGYKWLFRNQEVLTYMGMGILAILVNWFMYAAFVNWFPMEAANFLSWGITMLFTFFTNKIYVFHSLNFGKHILWKELATFFTTRGITGVLEIVMQPKLYEMGLSENLFGVSGLQAKITTCLILSVVNYFCTKIWVFRSKTA